MKVKKKWWGIKLHLSHDEACWVAYSAGSAAAISSYFGGWVGSLVGLALFVHCAWIGSTTFNSGGKGVICYITWSGNLFNVVRRGRGYSPCP